MKKGIQLVALIPAYQPDRRLYPLLQELQGAGFFCVVVDDGSGEAYRAIFQEAEHYATVLTHENNRGKGAALKTGLTYLEEQVHGEAVVVTVDADGQHRVEDAVRCCEAVEPESLVLGCRSFRGHVPLRSRMGNAITRGVFTLSTGVSVQDTQTGLRAFDRRLIPALLAIPGERYEYEMNMLLTWAREKRPIRQVEIATIYLDNNSSSHFDTLRDSARIYGDILKFAASSFTGFLVDYGLYSLLTLVTPFMGAFSVPFSNITARVVSAGVNYGINKKLVFKNHDSVARTATQYFALAACILAGNTVLLTFLVERLGWNRYAAKLLTEVTFFTASWLAQKFWIFRKKGDATEGRGTSSQNSSK